MRLCSAPHYDPDLCGSMANFIDMCDNPKLKVISEDRNNVFISFYIPRKRYPLIHSIAKDRYTFSLGGRTLSFVLTPYAHSPGSFVTYDFKSRTVFSSDLFGSYAATWDLFLSFTEECYTCENYEECPNLFTACPVKDILAFHKEIMPCKTALRHALKVIRQFCLERIAPQHGSILSGDRDISYILKKLERLEKVGIDAIV